jgi:hypothetical protein
VVWVIAFVSWACFSKSTAYENISQAVFYFTPGLRQVLDEIWHFNLRDSIEILNKKVSHYTPGGSFESINSR